MRATPQTERMKTDLPLMQAHELLLLELLELPELPELPELTMRHLVCIPSLSRSVSAEA